IASRRRTASAAGIPSRRTSSAPASKASDNASFFLPHRTADGTTAVYESFFRRWRAACTGSASRRASKMTNRGRARRPIDISSSAELMVTTEVSCASIHALTCEGSEAPSGENRIAFGCCKSLAFRVAGNSDPSEKKERYSEHAIREKKQGSLEPVRFRVPD